MHRSNLRQRFLSKVLRASTMTAVIPLAAVALAADVAADPATAPAAPSAQVVTGGAFPNAPTTYGIQVTGVNQGTVKGDQGPAGGRGDTWFSTWADDGDVYATSNDTSGFNGSCNSDITVNELAGSDPTQLTAPFVNCMTSFGHGGDNAQNPDGCTWKSGGITSIGGTLYLAVTRQIRGQCSAPSDPADGEQPSMNASIVKSTDHGRTWSNAFGTTNDPGGAAPQWDPALGRVQAMFPGHAFAAPFFINYGQDDNPAGTADGGDKYVYAVSNDGYAYDGNYMIVGRVPRSEIGDLNGSDWQFYTGLAGGDGSNPANWSSDVSKATHVLSAAHQISQPDVQYIAPLHRYVLVTFHYPFIPSTQFPQAGTVAQSTFTFYEAPQPWGPWTRFLSTPTTLTHCYIGCVAPNDNMPLGLYDPGLVTKFMRMDGLSNTIFTSGDFKDQSRPGDPKLYALHALPVVLTTKDLNAVDDSSAAVSYDGNWTATTFDTAASDYFQGTQHNSSTPGDSVSFGFTGSTIEWIGSTNKNHGYASVSIDGGPAEAVDGYSPAWVKQVTLFKRTGLRPGHHTITITVTASKNPASSGTFQDIDAFVVGS